MSSLIVGWFVKDDFPVCEDCIEGFSEDEISCDIRNDEDENLLEDIVCNECSAVIIESSASIRRIS
jgi:hypothetical protein